MGRPALGAAPAANFGQDPIDGVFIQFVKTVRQQVGKRGRLGAEPGGIENGAWMRGLGEALEVFGVIPDQAEIAAHLEDQTGRRPPSAAVLQRRQLGRRHP